jgi:hypothetical protein
MRPAEIHYAEAMFPFQRALELDSPQVWFDTTIFGTIDVSRKGSAFGFITAGHSR